MSCAGRCRRWRSRGARSAGAARPIDALRSRLDREINGLRRWPRCGRGSMPRARPRRGRALAPARAAPRSLARAALAGGELSDRVRAGAALAGAGQPDRQLARARQRSDRRRGDEPPGQGALCTWPMPAGRRARHTSAPTATRGAGHGAAIVAAAASRRTAAASRAAAARAAPSAVIELPLASLQVAAPPPSDRLRRGRAGLRRPRGERDRRLPGRRREPARRIAAGPGRDRGAARRAKREREAARGGARGPSRSGALPPSRDAERARAAPRAPADCSDSGRQLRARVAAPGPGRAERGS